LNRVALESAEAGRGKLYPLLISLGPKLELSESLITKATYRLLIEPPNVSAQTVVVASITTGSADSMELKMGDDVTALVKASSVMIMK